MAAGLARVEVEFTLDADGLLVVTAREESTNIVQSVEIKPSYGLTDEEVEAMLMASIENAEDDMEARLLIDTKVEAERLYTGWKKRSPNILSSLTRTKVD